MKKAAIIVFLMLCVSTFFSQETVRYFLTFSVKYGLKREGHVQEIFMDIGTSKDHPLSGKMTNIDREKVAIGNLSNVKVYSNEVDILQYLTNNGWEIVKIQEIKELSAPYKQYLMKLEIEE